MSSLGRLNSELETATHRTARRLQLGGIIDTAGSNMLAGTRGIVEFSYAKDAARVQSSRQLFDSAADAWQGAIDELRPLIVTDEGRGLVNQLQDELTAWRSAISDIQDAATRGQPDAAIQISLSKALPVYEANTRDAARLRQLENEILAQQQARGASIYSVSLWSVLAGLALTLVGGGLQLWVAHSSTLALRRTAAELSQASEQVAGAAGQICSSSQSLAQGASEQAASIEETSASSEEISAMTRKNVEDSRTAADLMTQTSQVVAEANRSLEEMQVSMHDINASSEKIAKIIRVIDEIAFQTNILALNAAVEAARAGEAGMGFAVVAEEVRNLAQRSAQAARDTASMIEESIARSSEGRVKLDQVSKAIRTITEKAGEVKVLMDGLNVSSGEQAHGVEQIAKAVTQVEQVTQTSAANAEETASAGAELSSQAAALRNLVARLEGLVGHAGSKAAVADFEAAFPLSPVPPKSPRMGPQSAVVTASY